MNSKDWIEKLKLESHPEGGYFTETYRSDELIEDTSLPARFDGSRNIATSIYFLLESEQVSKLHRIKSDEVWHFYEGSPLTLYIIDKEKNLLTITLGRDIENGQVLQYTVPHGCWFGAEVVDQDSFSLLGCTVAPGFDFQDFEMSKKDELFDQFPEHKAFINRLSKAI